MKKSLIVAASILLASCTTGNPVSSQTPTAVTVTDGIGRSVTMDPSEIKKVVCVGAGALRVYSYVGDMNLLSGVEDIDNPEKSNRFLTAARPYYMANADLLRALPSCGQGGPQHQEPEKIPLLNCEPDLIVSEYENAEVAAQMEADIGAKVFTVKIGSKACFDDVFLNCITSLGKLLGRESKAKAITDYVDDAKADLHNRTKDIAEQDKPSVYLAGLSNWGQGGLYHTSANYPAFEAANIKNIVSEQDLIPNTKTIRNTTFESMAPNIDKMILDSFSLKNLKDAYNEDNHLFDNVKAVQDGEVYLQLGYNVYYTNLEIALVDAYYDASVVYPEAFTDINIEAKCNEVTTLFNGKALYDEIKAMPDSRGGFQKITNLAEFLNQ